MAVPGGIGCFSFLQAALPLHGKGHVALTPEVHAELMDWRILLEALCLQPTHFRELILGKAG